MISTTSSSTGTQVQTVESRTGKPPSPFVKWAGGKNSLVASLLSSAPQKFSNYYEPFLGGGAFFFALYSRGLRFRAHLSDVNSDLINSYGVIEEEPEALIKALSEIQEEYLYSENKAAYYYEKRAWHPS
ncbi:MAG TPA: DNA adenine methylase, partial [Candidatus Binatus sp.]|nr:DNA adenine methylase [Candidatus Binatus sp.]